MRASDCWISEGEERGRWNGLGGAEMGRRCDGEVGEETGREGMVVVGV